MPNIILQNNIYAPYMPLIQSSGYGKSKITDELLKTYPGVSMVFRNQVIEDIQGKADCVLNFQRYIYDAPIDVFLIEEDACYRSLAIYYPSGRFLLDYFV